MSSLPPSALSSFYAGKRVWLSGHTGFKGGWLAYWLTLMGAKVGGYAMPPADGQPSLFKLVNLSERVAQSTFGDVRDAQAVQHDMQAFRPDMVFHLAAQALVRKSYREPLDTYTTNVIGSANVLNAARFCDGIKAIVAITSDKCYENIETTEAYRESDTLGGHDPYSSSKACAEHVASTWRRSYLQEQGKALATARAGNVIGGGDFSEDRIIPDFVAAAAENKSLIMRAPDATRPWQHVLDAVHGYLILGMKLFTEGQSYATGYNFSPVQAEPVTVQHIIDILIRRIGRGSYTIDPAARSLHEATLLRLDPAYALERLGWRVLLPIETCIAMTADWYGAYLNGGDVNTKTREQIIAFSEIAQRA